MKNKGFIYLFFVCIILLLLNPLRMIHSEALWHILLIRVPVHCLLSETIVVILAPVPHHGVALLGIKLNIGVVEHSIQSHSNHKGHRTTHHDKNRVRSWVRKPGLLEVILVLWLTRVKKKIGKRRKEMR